MGAAIQAAYGGRHVVAKSSIGDKAPKTETNVIDVRSRIDPLYTRESESLQTTRA